MRVHIGSDHAGFDLKQHLVQALTDQGYEVIDHGAEAYDAEDDYPTFCIPAAEGVVADPGSLGIVIGGSGNGEAIAAHKVDGVRCALAWNEDTAKLGRRHNNANVVSVGGRMHTVDEATQLIEWFLETPFSGDARHERRIQLLADYEASR